MGKRKDETDLQLVVFIESIRAFSGRLNEL